MPLFTWRGYEEPLGSVCAVAIELVIDAFVKEGISMHVKGTVKIKDYVERGIELSSPWEAFGDSQWIVRRFEDETVFCRGPGSEEAWFTMSGQLNGEIKFFIARMLNTWLQMTGEPRTDHIVMEPAEHEGPREKYTGDCVCEALENSSTSEPFPWRILTGGQFPERCFACSCGERWWCLDPKDHTWLVVTDPDAWEILLKYNGVRTRAMSLIESERGIILVRTLCDSGCVPWDTRGCCA